MGQGCKGRRRGAQFLMPLPSTRHAELAGGACAACQEAQLGSGDGLFSSMRSTAREQGSLLCASAGPMPLQVAERAQQQLERSGQRTQQLCQQLQRLASAVASPLLQFQAGRPGCESAQLTWFTSAMQPCQAHH